MRPSSTTKIAAMLPSFIYASWGILFLLEVLTGSSQSCTFPLSRGRTVRGCYHCGWVMIKWMSTSPLTVVKSTIF
jgi:hypothetical protein